MSVEPRGAASSGRSGRRVTARIMVWLSLFLVSMGDAAAFQFQTGPRHSVLSRTPSAATELRAEAKEITSDRVTDRQVHVVFVSGASASGYGATSPLPNPSWSTVAAQLAKRLPNFAGTIDTAEDTESGVDLIAAHSVDAETLREGFLMNVDGLGSPADVVVALGVSTPTEEARLVSALDYAGLASSLKNPSPRAVLAEPGCSPTVQNLRSAGPYRVFQPARALDDAISTIAPWGPMAAGKRLLEKTDTLLARKSSEDFLFAVLFAVHSLVADVDVVKSDINPSWEKGVVQNLREFKKMADCCGPQIAAALGDPQTKKAIDLLNAVDLRDQVGSYRVIVSNETPELEEFTLCILQQNDCFDCDAPILERPDVPLMKEWRGRPLNDRAARDILMGHLDHPSSHELSQKKPWSWKIVVGANPAYDAFPMQHQIFYPCNESRVPPGEPNDSKSLWYDPVFCVETLDDERIWCKRHYRCTPRPHRSGTKDGAWTLTTLDNGMVSEEHWTTVDCADDLSWAVLHYSGAARRAGQSYVGALLCTADGEWPEGFREGEGLERIREAFRSCDLELWELFGGSTRESFMWGQEFTDWKMQNPPDLDRIGDISVAKWRKQEREKARAEAGR